RRLGSYGGGHRGLPHLGAETVVVEARRKLFNVAAKGIRQSWIGSMDGDTQLSAVVDHPNRSAALVRVRDAKRNLIQRRCSRVFHWLLREMVDGGRLRCGCG